LAHPLPLCVILRLLLFGLAPGIGFPVQGPLYPSVIVFKLLNPTPRFFRDRTRSYRLYRELFHRSGLGWFV
jgi:hypothetical protein